MKLARKIFLGNDFFKLFTQSAILIILQKIPVKLSKIVLLKIFLQQTALKFRVFTNSVGCAYFSKSKSFKSSIIIFNGPVFGIVIKNTIPFKEFIRIFTALSNDFSDFPIVCIKLFNTFVSKNFIENLFKISTNHTNAFFDILNQISINQSINYVFDPVYSGYNNLSLLNYYCKEYLI